MSSKKPRRKAKKRLTKAQRRAKLSSKAKRQPRYKTGSRKGQFKR